MKFNEAIIGTNIKSAINIFKSKAKNNSIAQIIVANESNIINRPFNILIFKSLQSPVKAAIQHFLIKILKQKAAHLLIATSIEDYRQLSIFDKFFIKINNWLFTHQIETSKHTDQPNLYKLTYKSYKFSNNRLINSIINTGNNENFKVFHSYKNYKIENKNSLVIDYNTIIKADKIKEYSSSVDKKKNVFWFAYPNDELNLDKTIVINTNKEFTTTIMPWFDCIYVEFSGKNIAINNISKAIQLINNQDINIKFSSQKVLEYGSASMLLPNYNYLLYLSRVKNKLLGSNFDFKYNYWQIMEFCDIKYDEAKAILKSSQVFKKLFYKYGTEIDKIIYQAYEFWNELRDIDKTWIKAEIWYLIKHENCLSSYEYINRHTEEWLNTNNLDIEFIDKCFDELK